MRLSLGAFRHRNFRLFFAGQSLSLVGTWIQQIAVSWLIYRLTGSAFLLGVTAFAGQLPVLLVAPFAGIWSDRIDRRALLMTANILAAIQALALAALTFSGLVAPWHLIVLAAFLGIVSALETPVRQSFLVDMVDDRHDLPGAIALNSFMFNSGRLIGPSLAGLMIASLGEAVCFLINALSYLAVIGAVAAMRVAPRPGKTAESSLLQGIQEGVAYAWHFIPIRMLLGLLALVSLMATPCSVLMPLYAKEIFHGGARTLGCSWGRSAWAPWQAWSIWLSDNRWWGLRS